MRISWKESEKIWCLPPRLFVCLEGIWADFVPVGVWLLAPKAGWSINFTVSFNKCIDNSV